MPEFAELQRAGEARDICGVEDLTALVCNEKLVDALSKGQLLHEHGLVDVDLTREACTVSVSVSVQSAEGSTIVEPCPLVRWT